MACIGLGLLAVVGALLFFAFGKPQPLDTASAFSELNWVEPEAVRVGAVGTGPTENVPRVPASGDPNAPSPPPAADTPQATVRSLEPRNGASITPAVVVLAAVPGPTSTINTTTAPLPTATAAVSATAPATTNTDATSEPSAAAEPAVTEPPPGAAQGVTYCGPTTCGVGYKCCCDGCVPFEQACDPRSCAAQSGLSISVPCGMDLCDPGEVCCDARCGECAQAGECPEEPCR